jgi:signal transduction histidine kinase
VTTPERHAPAGYLLRLLRALFAGDQTAVVELAGRHGLLVRELLRLATVSPGEARAEEAPSGSATTALAARFERAAATLSRHAVLGLVRALLRDALAGRGAAVDAYDRWRDERLEAELVRSLAASQEDPSADGHALLVRLAHQDLPEGDGADAADFGLARDLHAFVERPVEELLDAHPALRYAHVARRAVRGEDPEGAGRAFERLFGVAVVDLRARLDDSMRAVDEDLAACRVAEQGLDLPGLSVFLGALERSCPLLAEPLAPERCLARCASAFRSLTGGNLRGLLLEPDGARLTGPPESELAEFVLATRPPRSRVAAVLEDGRSEVLRPGDELCVVDRQLLRIAGPHGLLVQPYGSGDVRDGVLLAGLPGVEAGDRGEDGEADRLLRSRLVLAECVHWLERTTTEARRRRRIEADYLAANERRLREVVHEANNPLSIVHNYLHILGLRLKDEETGREQLRMIGEEIRRTGDIIRSLLEVPLSVTDGGAGTATEPVSLNGLVSDLLGMLDAALVAPARVDVGLDLDDEDVTLRLDADRLKQVLSNLIRNAVEAMDAGGRLHVSTRARVVLHDKRFAEITVADTGPGLPADVFEHLFEPKATTKAGDHEGLGLAIVKQLVDELGGRIACETRAGEGTTFRLLLPLGAPPTE